MGPKYWRKVFARLGPFFGEGALLRKFSVILNSAKYNMQRYKLLCATQTQKGGIYGPFTSKLPWIKYIYRQNPGTEFMYTSYLFTTSSASVWMSASCLPQKTTWMENYSYYYMSPCSKSYIWFWNMTQSQYIRIRDDGMDPGFPPYFFSLRCSILTFTHTYWSFIRIHSKSPERGLKRVCRRCMGEGFLVLNISMYISRSADITCAYSPCFATDRRENILEEAFSCRQRLTVQADVREGNLANSN